jgi:hypothetical protein
MHDAHQLLLRSLHLQSDEFARSQKRFRARLDLNPAAVAGRPIGWSIGLILRPIAFSLGRSIGTLLRQALGRRSVQGECRCGSRQNSNW